MAAPPSLRDVVLRCRDGLREGRSRIYKQHQAGTPGHQISVLLTDLYDDLVLDVWGEACNGFETDRRYRGLALVAHGGFGRRDISPYSDVDLMLVTTRKSTGLAQQLAATLSRDLVDVGFQLGFSVRSPSEACSLAWSDPVIFTSLAESRFLAGSLNVYRRFFESMRVGSMRRHQRLIRDVVAARREERHKWGETNFLLRPNVKKSRGALRDIQLIRWLGFARHGETDLERLVKLDALPSEDYRRLRKAYSFILRLRNELHFRAEKSHDVLDREIQLQIADCWGYRGTEGVLPVEQFMQEYFEHTRNVRYASSFYVDDTRGRSFLGRALESLLSRKIDDKIRMGPTHIWVSEQQLPAFATNLADVLRLMHLASHHRRRISHETWQAIRHAMLVRDPEPPDAASISYFLDLLSRPGRLAPLLRRLNELRVLEQLVPAMKRCRGLLQFNAYHKYTVDAHCIRAVEAATDLRRESSAMGRRYRRLKDKTLLHLALLIHDLGKGYDEDHSEVGRRIAKQTADLYGLDEASSETLQWLVHKHLAVNVVAFRHNLNDPEVVLRFAAEVGSIRRLELLIVHSVADLAAVGPGVVTDWKMNLIEDLYRRTRRYFETGNLPGEDDPEIDRTRQQIAAHLTADNAPQACHDLLAELPISQVKRGQIAEVSAELIEIAKWLEQDTRSHCTASFDASVSAVRYTILHREGSERIGTFARATGALSSFGLTIMRANIETVGDEFVWDEFWVLDPDFPGEPPPSRITTICQTMCRLLESPDQPLPPQRQTWATSGNREPDSVNVLPTKVTFDNETLDRYTILSLFAYDRLALLSRVAKVFAEHQVVLHFAKIDTHLDQIADVFYVTEQNGERISGNERQETIRASLLEAAS